jgi:hypothetical protein
MLAIILCLFRFVRLLGSGHQAVAVENLALRLQLAAFKRKRKRPVVTQWDRLFWVGLSHVWSSWRNAMVFVQPDTIVRWQRERFRKFWARLSRPKCDRRGRPSIAAEIRQLILQMATANPLWRAPSIHGELKMLGIVISERTVSRILRAVRRPPPSQTSKTFLRNHLGQIVSVDFFTVPYRSRSRVRAAFCAALLNPAFPFVRTAFWAAWLRLAAPRLRALAWAWRERAKCDAACLPSRSRAFLVARDLVGDAARPGEVCP